jgi:hypothetical protein
MRQILRAIIGVLVQRQVAEDCDQRPTLAVRERLVSSLEPLKRARIIKIGNCKRRLTALALCGHKFESRPPWLNRLDLKIPMSAFSAFRSKSHCVSSG